ncbi:hypothetical protein [Clostridium thermopalmarium]|uniref:Uncharacterized protein n=1 Tax=Clostridium thermopalmarium DSM 5974 TaxID=1121340 RepID=A0A2T0AXQ5_9CLOT|nr:hypothetical protein [Clostridium thermopalmarium]PRR75671.1 hypothetical protein CPAL_05020 [Clostridium thermopalmarium DSM 5974]PVZ26641.1 hypothetical protein LX19_00719 [Clostridium thermopalmarium DSM 5974]
MRYADDLKKACNRNENDRDVAVITLSYNIATNEVTDFDLYPSAPFEATQCDIEVGQDLADVVACLLRNGFELVSNVAATAGTTTTVTALGHYTFVKR